MLHNFGNGTDGAVTPTAGLIIDAAGNLYGTTDDGGAGTRDGVRVEAQPYAAGGGWTEKVLLNFGDTTRTGTCHTRA